MVAHYNAYFTSSQPHPSYNGASKQLHSENHSLTFQSLDVVLSRNTNHLQVLPREPDGLQLAQHQHRAEVLTDLGRAQAQHMLDKLPLVTLVVLAVRTPWNANSSGGNTFWGKKKKSCI